MCILSRRLLSMSLPASLTTDCGGLLNHRSPGRKRCCHTEALHAGYHVYSSHGLFLSRIIELVYFYTEHHGRSRGFVTNYRNSFFTRRVSGFMSRIIEFLFTRRITEFFFVTRHVLGPEFANCLISFFTRMVVEVMRVEL